MSELSAASDVLVGSRPRELPRPFSWKCELGDPGSVWLRLTGELDLSDCPQLRRALSEAGERATNIAVDLRELSFIDCAGIGTLLDVAAEARRHGGELRLLGATGQVAQVLELTGIGADVGRLELVIAASPQDDADDASRLDGGSRETCGMPDERVESKREERG